MIGLVILSAAHVCITISSGVCGKAVAGGYGIGKDSWDAWKEKGQDEPQYEAQFVEYGLRTEQRGLVGC